MKNGLVIDEYGTKHWYKNDEFHREDGPAIEWTNGTKEWFINGKRHREDGPAVEWSSGTKSWWINGEYIQVKSQEEFLIYRLSGLK